MTKVAGFSILEITIVLVLISLILGVFLMRTSGFSDLTRSETARGDLRAIQKAINAYYLNYYAHGSYSYPSGSDWQNNNLANDNPKVLRQILYDPFRSTNTEYSYYLSANGKYYTAFSYGPNRNADITGISDIGALTGSVGDDIYVTNGS